MSYPITKPAQWKLDNALEHIQKNVIPKRRPDLLAALAAAGSPGPANDRQREILARWIVEEQIIKMAVTVLTL